MPRAKTTARARPDPTLIRLEAAGPRATVGHLHDRLAPHLLRAAATRELRTGATVRLIVAGPTPGRAKRLTLRPSGTRTRRGQPVRTTVTTPRRPDVRHDWRTVATAVDFAVDQASAWARVELERRAADRR